MRHTWLCFENFYVAMTQHRHLAEVRFPAVSRISQPSLSFVLVGLLLAPCLLLPCRRLKNQSWNVRSVRQKFPLPRREGPLGTWGTSAPFPPRPPAHTTHQAGQVSQPCTAVAAPGEEPGRSKGRTAGRKLPILPYPVPEEGQEN